MEVLFDGMLRSRTSKLGDCDSWLICHVIGGQHLVHLFDLQCHLWPQVDIGRGADGW